MSVVPSIICSGEYYGFTLCIDINFNVLSFGKSECAAHGHRNENIFPIRKINHLTNIKMICCGNYHSICLNYSGNIFTFGDNEYGQLGKNISSDFTYIPQLIEIPVIKYISCGNLFNICLSEDGFLYSFGNNSLGQLGLHHCENTFLPEQIPNLENIDIIECGCHHSICKNTKNEVYSWGYCDFGQLGIGNIESYVIDDIDYCDKPIQCNNWPDNIISVKCNNISSLVLTEEGKIYSFGDNDFGQLGLNDITIEDIDTPTLIQDIPKIQRIEKGNNHFYCIDINNNLWLFGGNGNGQLGLGDTKNRYKPVMHPTLSNIIDISSGGNHTFVKTSDHEIFSFGMNNNGQIGLKTPYKNQLTPVQVFINTEDNWCSLLGKSKAKSARK